MSSHRQAHLHEYRALETFDAATRTTANHDDLSRIFCSGRPPRALMTAIHATGPSKSLDAATRWRCGTPSLTGSSTIE
ncbi:hypothetical protein BT93_I0303 [Corymbia citriodora subsp. variegata]|nr:hypothetical protein BT93_I0303 [Corymbia citriodora subsp. variegata]